MSTEPTPRDESTEAPDPREQPGKWIRANETWLRALANSDASANWVAERLLYSEELEP